MPEALYPAFRRVLDTYHAVRSSDGSLDLALYRHHVLEGLREIYEHVEASDLDSMIDKLARVAAMPAALRKQNVA
jgi:hypothetical protein